MKRKVFLCVLLSVAMVLSGCSLLESLEKPEAKAFVITDYNLELTADTSYTDVTKDSPFDLQITNDHLYLGVMAYDPDDVNESDTAESVFEFQNNDLMSKRENVVVTIEKTTEQLDDRIITHMRWNADYEGTENCYDSYMVEFKNSDVFAWVLISIPPSNLNIYNTDLKNIVYSLKLVKQK